MKETNKGFKERINSTVKLLKGYKRQFVKCKICKNLAYYDYVPYSLSNPVAAAPCDHNFRTDYKHI